MTLEMVIRFTPETGRVEMTGPLENRLVCYGMLEMAREIIATKGAGSGNGGGSKIVVPAFVPPKLVP